MGKSKTETMSYVKLWVHAVWSTKRRQPWLAGANLNIMCEHIVQNAVDKGIFIDTIYGYDEHIHVLMLLSPEHSISRQMQLIKGESAHWANETDFINEKFAWSVKYFAASVSGRKVPSVRAYIRNQQTHHATTTFADEFNHFLKSAGYDAQLLLSQD